MIRVNSEQPKVAIIILNWNGLEDTVECLESLKGMTYSNYEVVLVDNGSEGNDAEILRKRFGDYIHLIENDKNYGFAEGCNIGMKYALSNLNPDYILLLNNDTVVDPKFLTELVQVAESDSSIGIVGPKIYYHDQPNKFQSAGGQISWWTGQESLVGCTQVDSGQFDEIREVDWVIGCALLIKRETIREIGLLHAAYFAYVEETDWCARCASSGYRIVYVPRAKVWHKRRIPVDRVDELGIYYMTRNQFLFMKRNATKLQFISFLTHFFLRRFPFTAAGLLIRHKDLPSLARYVAGIRDGIRLTLKGDRDGG